MWFGMILLSLKLGVELPLKIHNKVMRTIRETRANDA